jgi:hypothetical protein
MFDGQGGHTVIAAAHYIPWECKTGLPVNRREYQRTNNAYCAANKI